MTTPIRSRRLPRCEGCALPPPLCLCAHLPALLTRTRIILLVHRVELHKTTNTARLARRCLTKSELLVRGRGAAEPVSAEPGGRRLVLFPAPAARVLVAPDAGDAREVGALNLIVPDGSWPQAQRMARRDPACRGVELVRLPDEDAAESRYGLRRSPRPGGLCTLEAVARALAILEGPDAALPLLSVLDEFTERVREVRRLGNRLKESVSGPPRPPSPS